MSQKINTELILLEKLKKMTIRNLHFLTKMTVALNSSLSLDEKIVSRAKKEFFNKEQEFVYKPNSMLLRSDHFLSKFFINIEYRIILPLLQSQSQLTNVIQKIANNNLSTVAKQIIIYLDITKLDGHISMYDNIFCYTSKKYSPYFLDIKNQHISTRYLKYIDSKGCNNQSKFKPTNEIERFNMYIK